MTIKELIAQGENSRLEFKSRIDNPVRIAKTLVAFANTTGGILLVGVEDNRNICGIYSETELLSLLEEASDVYCQPPILVSCEVIDIESKSVLVVTIPESNDKPHFVKEKNGEETLYVRMNNKSVPTGKVTARSLNGKTDIADKALLQSIHVKTLLKYLQANEYITAKRYAKLVNISERRASKLLMELVGNQIVLPVERDKDVVYTFPVRHVTKGS